MAAYNPGGSPYSNPQLTISAPLAPRPLQLSNAATLINGGYSESGCLVFRNGILLTEGVDFSRNQGVLTFVVPPLHGDTMTALVFSIGKNLSSTTPTRYVSPWQLQITGPYDGIGVNYGIVFPPTISGNCDGTNPIFNFQIQFARISLWRNGVLQTAMVDYNAGATAIAFLPGAIPQPGDLLTLLGYNSC